MKYRKLLNFLVIFFVSNTLIAGSSKYKLRRFDEDENNGVYNSNYKYYLESDSDRDNCSDNNLIRSENGEYSGYYKIGKPYTVLGQTYYPQEDEEYDEVGMASWYGSDFHKKKTANGEIYNMNDYTAAHRTLPMPCMVKVTNLENGKSVNVRINDRGPFVKDRIIDVSKNVAEKLDFHEKGTTKIRVRFLKKESMELRQKYGLM